VSEFSSVMLTCSNPDSSCDGVLDGFCYHPTSTSSQCWSGTDCVNCYSHLRTLANISDNYSRHICL